MSKKIECQTCGNFTHNVPPICDDCLSEAKEYQKMAEEGAKERAAQASEPVNVGIDYGDGPSITVTETLNAKPELTPQDKGEPSPVPYSIFLQKPSPDIDPKGQTIIRMNLALPSLAECDTRWLVPHEVMPFIVMADKSFRQGYYRFELIVGDWSIKVYKHPNNP